LGLVLKGPRMDWTFLTAAMADAATTPTMFLICTLIVFAAGVLCGLLAREAFREPSPLDDAGDTHAQLDSVICAQLPRPRARAGQPHQTCIDGSRRRVRPATHRAEQRPTT
jgi:hypothetical protein